MLLCSAELARRIERAERGLIEDCAAAVPRVDGAAFEIPIAGGLASFAGLDSPLTKVVGLGFARAAASPWSSAAGASRSSRASTASSRPVSRSC